MRSGSRTTSPLATHASPVCNATAITSAGKALIKALNEHDPNALQQVLSPDVLGDISRKDQGVDGQGTGYQILNGFPHVLGFLQKQWALGEMMSYTRVKPAGTGGYVIGLIATYSDGTKQTFTDTKFAYSCSGGAIEHFSQVANAPAS